MTGSCKGPIVHISGVKKYNAKYVTLNKSVLFHLSSYIRNSCFVFHQGFQTPRNNKSTRLATSCFHLFLGVWNPWWSTKHSFLIYYLTHASLSTVHITHAIFRTAAHHKWSTIVVTRLTTAQPTILDSLDYLTIVFIQNNYFGRWRTDIRRSRNEFIRWQTGRWRNDRQ